MDFENAEEKEQFVCADCGAQSPEWASINRGVLLCSECCSVHRNLGRSISQIRSLKKGAWNANQLSLINLLYRSGANNIWEHSLLDLTNGQNKSKKKPNSNDPVIPKKETFIKNKYAHLTFAIRPTKDDSLTLDDLNKQLWCCVRTSHVETTLRLLALGANPNYADSDKGNTTLHVAAKEGQALQSELLWIYGADVAQRNADGLTPAGIARAEDNLDLALRLDELEFEVTDRFSMFLSGRKPEHINNQNFLIPELVGQISPHIKQFRSLLQNSSNIVLERLIQDVYDEVDRREVCIQWHTAEQYRIENYQHVAVFLPPSPRLSATRNQLRQKLAKFDSRDFSQLIIDLLKDIRRRYLGLPLPPPHVDNRSNALNPSVHESNTFNNENVIEESRDYDEVAADKSLFNCKFRLSNSTKSEPKQKTLLDVADNNSDVLTNTQVNNEQSIAFDNYLELREKLYETTEKLDNVLTVNSQLTQNLQSMQATIERLQSDQLKMQSHIDLMAQITSEQQNSLQLITSSSALRSSLPLTTSEVGTIVSPTSVLVNNFKQSVDSYSLPKASVSSRLPIMGRLAHYRQNSLTSPINLSTLAENTAGRKSSVSTLPLSNNSTLKSISQMFSPSRDRDTGNPNDIVSNNSLNLCQNGSALPRFTSKSTQSLGIKNEIDSNELSAQNKPTIKALFNDEVFPDNLILETELLTGAIKGLLADLQQKDGSNDANAVFHADSIGHHITWITRAIPPSHMTSSLQKCVYEMELAMSELTRKCMMRPLITDDTCCAAYDVAKAAKQLLVTVHNRSGGF